MDDILIGIDFDNTIVCYDSVFYETAIARKMIGGELQCRSKEQVRDYLRGIGREDQWTLLQGYVYGMCMSRASPFPSVIDFLQLCREKRIFTAIVSHKTLFSLNGPKYDLHYAARKWLRDHQIDKIVSQFHFEPTREDKLHRISQVGCTHFIDDLPEFLAEPNFPKGVERLHFDPIFSEFKHQFRRLHSWAEAIEWIISL